MRRFYYWLLLIIWVTSGTLPLALPANAAAPLPAAPLAAPRGEAEAALSVQTMPLDPTPTPARSSASTPSLAEILAQMTVADRVGQLFLITFQGRDVAPDSDIAVLVRDYRVGGVVLLPENNNFRNIPIVSPASPSVEQPMQDTPAQIAELANALQLLAFESPLPLTAADLPKASNPVTLTEVLTPTAASITPGLPITATATATATQTAAQPAPQTALTATVTPETPANGVPLWIALDWPGDDSSFFAGTGGFTPLPSAMAVGATWSPALAEQVGQVVGSELQAVGVNMLLGPTLDVLDVPRPGNKGDLGTRTFGGDPFWVGQIGRAFIRGVQLSAQGGVLTAAKHFPGQGGSDRRPEDEVPTVQRPLQQLRQIELAPFAAVTAGSDLQAPGITDALVTSHIRYRGLQASIREVTPPISLAPQLQDLMALTEFADWRMAGGMLISEALGVPALRRYYDPTLTKFPHRQVAQDAFLAGNDLLYLGRFALTDNWPDQVTAIKETILFFQDKYRSDSTFRARVDAAVERIIRQKLNVYGGSWLSQAPQHDIGLLVDSVGQGGNVAEAVARAGLTLIYPGKDELADRIPSAPLAGEEMVIITDARSVKECATCEPAALIAPTAIEEIILRLYGPAATGQIAPGQVRSFTFDDLYRSLTQPAAEASAVESAIAAARWIIFAQLDYNPDEYPESAALRTFLASRSDNLRDKKLVVLSVSAPYYLDTTEISKLTAYFGIYSHTQPFLETAVRALFREFTPVGAPPVSVTGINYDLSQQLEPAAGQIISLNPVGAGEVITRSIQVGSQLELETGVILDRKGHPVPDGTLVEFYLRYPAESLALAPKVETTLAGKARTLVALDRPGELWITVQSGEARDSTRIELKVGGDAPGSIATVLPTWTPEPTLTLTLTPESTPTLAPTPSPMPTPPPGPDAAAAEGPRPRVTGASFLFGLAGTLLAGGVAFLLRRRRADVTKTPQVNVIQALTAALWAGAAAWIGYLLYAVGWLPGATALQATGHAWIAGVVTLVGGLLVLPWLRRSWTKP